MTITEQLQFSVLTAPVAAVDRRALSQAWYSALYGTGGSGSTAVKAARPLEGAASEPKSVYARARATSPPIERHATLRAAAVKTVAHAEGAPADRRAPRSPLARKIERAFLHPRSNSKKTSFSVDGEEGRVHVILQSRGLQLKLIAICPEKARAQVAAALAQARYALAMRGIDLDADTRSAVPC
jgi:hypothetical protein